MKQELKDKLKKEVEKVTIAVLEEEKAQFTKDELNYLCDEFIDEVAKHVQSYAEHFELQQVLKDQDIPLCPVCDSKPRFVEDRDYTFIKCENCGCKTESLYIWFYKTIPADYPSLFWHFKYTENKLKFRALNAWNKMGRRRNKKETLPIN